MKNFLLLVASVVLVALIAAGVHAKSYSVESMRIDAVASTDGSIRIEERITYRFEGSFSWAYRDIPLKSGENITEVSVAEGGRAYERVDADAAWTYTESSTGNDIRIKWRFEAEDETRTFVVSYVMKGVVRRYPDVAEVYLKLVGEGWERSIGRVDAEIRLPAAADGPELRAWAHGPLHATVKPLPGAVVAVEASPLPARTYLEARVICPAAAFTGVARAPGGERLAAILAEETELAERANEKRREWRQRLEREAEHAGRRVEMARELLPLSIFLAIAGLGIWFWLHTRYGRAHPVVSRSARGDVPSDHRPAVVSYLLYRMVTAPALAATLVDLAHRGYLEVRETVVEKRSFFGRKTEADYRFDVVAKPLSGLEAYERDLLQFVLTEAGDSSGFTVSALRKAASRGTRFRKFFRDWNKQVAERAREYRFFEPYPVGAMVGNALCGVVVIGAGVAITVATETAAGVPAIVGGFLQAVFTMTLSRRTPEGRRLSIAWKDFRAHLKSLARGRGPVTLDSTAWGSYLGAAILFGMHDKLLPNLRLENGGTAVYPAWFYAAGGSEGIGGGVSGLASGLSSMVAAVSTAASSAAGAGGGASGGGGGGSGGGGGGAG